MRLVRSRLVAGTMLAMVFGSSSHGADPAAIREQVKKEKQITLQKDGLRLVAEGVTSLEELQRVFKPA